MAGSPPPPNTMGAHPAPVPLGGIPAPVGGLVIDVIKFSSSEI